MRISDWSADVCSSDLDRPQEPHSRTDADEGCGHHRVRGRRKPGRVHLPPDRAPVANAAAQPGAAFRRRRSEKCADLFAGNFPASTSLALCPMGTRACLLSRSGEHTSEISSLIRNSYEDCSLTNKKHQSPKNITRLNN